MLSQWASSQLADVWKEDGVSVVHVAGVATAPEADVVIVHVDLSVVPDEYLSFAARYPNVVNGGVKDIRKSALSRHLVQPNDGWSGPVIVKSNLNCAGRGEQLAGGGPRELFPFPIRRQVDYRVYASANEVPPEYYDHPLLVVERFLPEREGDRYRPELPLRGRNQHDRSPGLGGPHRARADERLDRGDRAVPRGDRAAPRARDGLRKDRLRRPRGSVVILDVNKTTGAGGVSADPKVIELRRRRARGMYSFLPGGAP